MTPAPHRPRRSSTARRSGSRPASKKPASAEAESVDVRRARRRDVDRVVAIDAAVTGIEKRDYWRRVFGRYGDAPGPDPQFLVADAGGRVVGFVIGEVRDWEFGSPPCGWVFAIDVAPEARLAGIGARLLAAVCDGFRRAGVRQVRTLLARDDTLVLSFFRSQGMMAAPLIPLEMDLDR
ncbi:MAG TPA: GNAT family N-acetyltransferase [Casimicrobiaceae bacterium]